MNQVLNPYGTDVVAFFVANPTFGCHCLSRDEKDFLRIFLGKFDPKRQPCSKFHSLKPRNQLRFTTISSFKHSLTWYQDRHCPFPLVALKCHPALANTYPGIALLWRCGFFPLYLVDMSPNSKLERFLELCGNCHFLRNRELGQS